MVHALLLGYIVQGVHWETLFVGIHVCSHVQLLTTSFSFAPMIQTMKFLAFLVGIMKASFKSYRWEQYILRQMSCFFQFLVPLMFDSVFTYTILQLIMYRGGGVWWVAYNP